MEVVGVLLIMVGVGLSNSAGLGGGSVSMSILLIFFNFGPHDAAPLCTFLIFGGVLSAVIIAFRMKHPKYPKVNKPLVNFNCVLILLPGMLVGSKIG